MIGTSTCIWIPIDLLNDCHATCFGPTTSSGKRNSGQQWIRYLINYNILINCSVDGPSINIGIYMHSRLHKHENQVRMWKCRVFATFQPSILVGNRPLGSCAVYFWLEPTCLRHLLTIFSSRVTCPDDGGDTFLRIVGSNQKYTAQDPRRRFPA
jgi:hypothetical protein